MNVQKIQFSIYGRRILEKRFIPILDTSISKIYYIHDGWIDIKVEDKTYRLEKGHLYLIPNALANVMTMHIEYVDHTYFDFFTFPRICNSSIIDIPLADEPILESYMRALSLYVEKNPRRYKNIDRDQTNFVTSALHNLLFLISEKFEIMSSKDDLVENVIDYVHKAYMQKLSVSELANLFHMEEGTLIRRFKRATSMTPYRYIKLLRVNHAQSLIEEGNHTLEEVAQAVGYADAPTLSHAIKSCGYDYLKE